MFQNNTAKAPNYQLTRYVTANDDATSRGKYQNGIKTEGYKKLLIIVAPFAVPVLPKPGEAPPAAGTSNPVIEIRFWCPYISQFIKRNPAVTIAAGGAGVPLAFEVDCYGRDVMIDITGGVVVGEGVAIFASASDGDQDVG